MTWQGVSSLRDIIRDLLAKRCCCCCCCWKPGHYHHIVTLVGFWLLVNQLVSHRLLFSLRELLLTKLRCCCCCEPGAAGTVCVGSASRSTKVRPSDEYQTDIRHRGNARSDGFFSPVLWLKYETNIVEIWKCGYHRPTYLGGNGSGMGRPGPPEMGRLAT